MILKAFVFALITFGTTMVVALVVAIIVKLIAMAVRGKKTAPPKSTKS